MVISAGDIIVTTSGLVSDTLPADPPRPPGKFLTPPVAEPGVAPLVSTAHPTPCKDKEFTFCIGECIAAIDHAFIHSSGGITAPSTSTLPVFELRNSFVETNGSIRRGASSTGSTHNSTKNKKSLVAIGLSKVSDPEITGPSAGSPSTTGGSEVIGATDVSVGSTVNSGGSNSPSSHMATARPLASTLVPTDNTFHAVITTFATVGTVV